MKLRTLVIVGAVAGSLALNVATVAFSSVAALVSVAYETVTGAASVVGAKDRKAAGLADDLAAREARILQLQDEVVAGQRQVTDLTDDLARQEAKLAGLQGELAELRKGKIVKYRGRERLLSEAVEDTATRVSKRTAAGAARNAGSVAAEAIPFVGVAVIVGVTAWDLKDSCDTIRDLHELELAFNPGLGADPDATEVCGMTVPTKEDIWQTVKSSPGKAWSAASAHVPDLPTIDWQSYKPTWPAIDWKFWD